MSSAVLGRALMWCCHSDVIVIVSRGMNASVSLMSVTAPITSVACCPLQIRLQKLRKRLSVQSVDGSTFGMIAATL